MFSLVSQRLMIDVVFDNQKWRNAVTNINLNLNSNTIQAFYPHVQTFNAFFHGGV